MPQKFETQRRLIPNWSPKFFDAIFQVSSAVVTPPYLQRADRIGQVGQKGLKAVASNLQQLLASGLRPLIGALTHHDEPLPNPVPRHLLHLQSVDLGLLPHRILMPAQALNILSQSGHKDIPQPQFLSTFDHRVVTKTAVPSHQSNPDVLGQAGDDRSESK